VTTVDLYINGQLYGHNTIAPFTFSLDTTQMANDEYVLKAFAYDEAGNQGITNNVFITIKNTGNSQRP